MHAILKERSARFPLAERAGPPALERIVGRCLEKSRDEALLLLTTWRSRSRGCPGAVSLRARSRRSPPPKARRPGCVPCRRRHGARPRGPRRGLAAVARAARPRARTATCRSPPRQAGKAGRPGRRRPHAGVRGRGRGVLQVFTRGLEASMAAQVTQSPRDCTEPFWSHDGRRDLLRLAAPAGAEPVDGGRRGGLARARDAQRHAAALTPDGQRLFRAARGPVPGQLLPVALGVVAAGSRAQALRRGAVQGEALRGRLPPRVARRRRGGALGRAHGGRDVGQGSRLCKPRALARADRADAAPGAARAAEPTRSEPLRLPARLATMVFAGEFRERTPGTHLFVADTASDDHWPLTARSGAEQYPAVSPSGRQIAFTDQREDYDLVEIPARRHGAAQHAGRPPETKPIRPGHHVGQQYAYVTDRPGGRRSGSAAAREASNGRSWPERASRTRRSSSPGSPPRPTAAGSPISAAGAQGFKVWISAVAGGPAVQLVNWTTATRTLRPGRPTQPGSRTRSRGRPPGARQGARWAPGAAVVLKEGIVYPSNPKWSPNGAHITCDLPEGFSVLSSRRQRMPGPGGGDPAGSRVGPKTAAASTRSAPTTSSRLQLVAIDVASGPGERRCSRTSEPYRPAAIRSRA